MTRIDNINEYYTEDSICTSKKRLTKKVARIVASILTMKLGERMESYKCKLCEHYHVGHAINPYNKMLLIGPVRGIPRRINLALEVWYNTGVSKEVHHVTTRQSL